MQSSLKKVIAASVLVGSAFGATAAFADVAHPNTGNGELTLFVENTTTHEVYARGLGITLDQIITESAAAGTYSGPTAVSFSFAAIGADTLLTQFLGTGTTGEFKWGVLAGDSVGTNAAGTRRYVLGTQVDLAASGAPIGSNTTLNNITGSVNSFFTDVNTNLPDGPGTSLRGFGSAGGLWDAAGTAGDLADTFFNQPPNQAFGFLGDNNAINMFVLTSAGGGNPVPARVFILADIALSANGTLHQIQQAPPVPLPAAVWLLGSGLIGLAGIGRRRLGPAITA
ncbi:MAG TPA: VPLPA-CTERM sorting domain-containing protein [Steroidobacteraceae bacterium]|nr:VPLPA-CTERM sorting domain-containing protein [Steroidobacteraceae bacterium]